MRIVIDHRERTSRVYELLGLDDTVELHVQELSVGDYEVDERVLVERKTFGDFMQSVVDARLFRQANALCKASRLAVIVIEGRTHNRRAGLGRPQLQGALLTLALVFRLPVIRSRGPEETVWLLKAIARQASRRTAKGLASRHWNPRDAEARRIHVLGTCPGVGPERAERILEHFGSLQAAFSATERELCAVSGVGPKTARALREFVSRRSRVYVGSLMQI